MGGRQSTKQFPPPVPPPPLSTAHLFRDSKQGPGGFPLLRLESPGGGGGAGEADHQATMTAMAL